MKIWVDLANSPQVLFFRPILCEFERRGHTPIVTTRAYAQTTQLADRLGIPHTVIGQHGGRGFLSLAKQNFLRSFALANWARVQHFDLAVSHNSYSQAVAARLVSIPMVTAMDYEYQPLNHLCFRLAQCVIVPQVFPDELLRKYGASRKAMRYPGLKEQVYLADYAPPNDFRQQEDFPVDRPLIVVRPPAPWTAYHRFENDLFDQLLSFLDDRDELYILFLPRMPSQVESVRHLKHIHVAQKVYDGPGLLFHADAVISGGGTMNHEAAVLGTPTYTIFRGKLGAVDRYLIDAGRMVEIACLEDFSRIRLEQKEKEGICYREPALVEQLATMFLEGMGNGLEDETRLPRRQGTVRSSITERMLAAAVRKPTKFPHIFMQQSTNTPQRENLHQVMNMLGAAGIPVIILKESPFPGLAPNEIEQRPISDLEIFIRPEHAERAVAALIVDDSPVCQDGRPVETMNISSLYVIRSHHTLIYILQEDR